jgi:dTDP-4-amino-4,6-dideoxygalactose transaminase
VIPAADLSRAHAAIRPELDAAIAAVLDRNWYILGPEVEAFEAEFAAYLGVAYAVGVGNGTDAITLTLRALGIGAGDEVITTPLTAAPTVGAVVAAGATPVLADVDPRSRTLDPAAVAAAITPRTRALLPVHLYGQPADMPALLALARRHGLALIEDAAQAHGARISDRMAGSLGVAACFSFYPTKNLGALGDGGAIVTSDAALAERLRRLRNLGQAARYVHEQHATHSRLDDIQAAVLRVKLRHLDAWTAERRRLATRYGAGLAGTPGVCLPSELPGTACCWHQYVVEVAERERVRERLRAAGAGSDVHYPAPVHHQRAYAHLAPSGALPVAERLAATVLSLPLFPGLTDAEQDHVIAALHART